MDSTVLVIDDNPLDRQVFEIAFKKEGINVVTLGDPTQSLDYAIQHSPSFIVLDICMPERDGFEVCSILKTHPSTRDIPIVFVSGNDVVDENSPRSLQMMGVIDYFHKPVSIETVIKQVMKHNVLSEINKIMEPMRRDMQEFCDKYKDGLDCAKVS